MNIVLFESDEMSKPLPLTDERARHCLKVLRKKAGDFFWAGIIGGKQGNATIKKIDEKFLHFDFCPQKSSEPLLPISLVLGFPRPIQLRRILRDAASLGVSEINLCATDLGEKSYRDSSLSNFEAARKALVEGAAQARSTFLPAINFFDSVQECAKKFSQKSRFFLDEQEKNFSFFDIARANALENCVLAIGSERGWSDEERSFFKGSNWQSASLGTRILRCETACVCAVELAICALSDSEKKSSFGGMQ